ncbi:MAG TPA: YfjI family protein [Candidatus Obscuribacterales bacterium]
MSSLFEQIKAALESGESGTGRARVVADLKDPSPLRPDESAAQLQEWPEPQEIKSELLPVAPLPPDIIPEPFREYVTDVSRRMQCPLDFVATAYVVMAGAVIGAGCGIRPKRRDDWLVIPNLWGGVIARPGKLKSPALHEAFRALSRLEAKSKEDYEQADEAYQAEVQVYEATKRALRDHMTAVAKGTKKSAELPDMDELRNRFASLKPPAEPVWRRYRTNDATIEKITDLLKENPRGLLVVRDELIGQLTAWDREGHEQDRAFFLEAWNGFGSFTADRIGRGTVHADNLCVSLFGGIQPSKLLNYLYQASRGNDNDGLVQRLQVLVYPDTSEEWELVDDYPDTAAKNRAFTVIETLASMDFVAHGAIKAETDRIPYFRFDDQAQQLFYEWLTELERVKLKHDDEPIVIEHLSKYRSLMPSLALIFHLVGVADGTATGDVGLPAAEMAAAWCDYLETHARRIYGQVAGISQKAAANLAKKIRQGALQDGFTLRDVHQNDWSFLSDREVVADACETLIEAGWLQAIPVTPGKAGGRRTIRYFINPKVRRG